VELGLGASLRQEIRNKAGIAFGKKDDKRTKPVAIGAIVFGSDQGLVGRFNEEIAEYAVKTINTLQGSPQVWAVGERVHARLIDAGIKPLRVFAVPNSIMAINPLVGQIQIESEAQRAKGRYSDLFIFHNRPLAGNIFEPTKQRLLPLDQAWQEKASKVPWPTGTLPEVLGNGTSTLRALIREHLYISLFKACAESLASENASRLAAMERADKNINSLQETLQVTFHRLRQEGIDEELFDVIAGFQALEGSQ
jgi:F-type H+-transporting ATPase subunit gamma